MPERTETGLKKETIAALAYLFGPISGFMILILEKDSFIRFHAMQSIVVLGVVGFLAAVLWIAPVISSILWLLYFFVLLFGMFKASQGEKYKLPVVSDYVEKMLR